VSRRQGIALSVAAATVVGILIASAAGWLGGVVVCGADRTPGCVVWPMPVSEMAWAAFILGVAALVIWQVRT
jgi:hypothetical protein